MRVYELRFVSLGQFSRAVDVVLDSDRVASYTVEPQLRRLRFLAPPVHADALVEALYAEGGLAWCSRHEARPGRALRPEPPDGHRP